MARYKYLGEPPRPGLAYHAMTEIASVPTKMGPSATYTPVPPKTEFVIGQDIGYVITDPISIAAFDADSRFQKIV